MTISADGKIDTELLYAEDLADLQPAPAVVEMEDRWIAQINESLGKIIGYSEVVLDNYDSEGNRLVRNQSTNTGDFAADALYYLFDEMGLDVDIAIMHGSGIRNKAITGEYRVKDVQILNKRTGEYEPLDLTKTYKLAGHNYTLRDHGDGFAMFDDAVCVVDYVSEDYMVLAKYIQSFPVDEATGLPTIRTDSDYGDVYGSGRITIISGN